MALKVDVSSSLGGFRTLWPPRYPCSLHSPGFQCYYDKRQSTGRSAKEVREREAQSEGDPPPPAPAGNQSHTRNSQATWALLCDEDIRCWVICSTAQEAARRLSVKEVLRPAPTPVTEMSSSVGTEVGGRKEGARIAASDCGTLLFALLQIQRGFLPPFLRRTETSGGPTHCKHDSAPYPTLSVCLSLCLRKVLIVRPSSGMGFRLSCTWHCQRSFPP